MNKKLITALVALSLLMPVSANANLKNNNLKPAVAILDTAIDTSLPIFKDRIIQEVCLLERGPCPNGQKFQEGPGAASLPSNFITKNGFDHGTQMSYLAANANSDMNIVFVRIIGNNPDGIRQVATEETVYNALQWVIDNASKYNIQAVTMAQSARNFVAGTNYCPRTPTTQSKIKSLTDAGIPVFLPAGNDFDLTRINWPACLPESIAIGATTPTSAVAVYSNYDSKLIDFYAQGTTSSFGPGNVKVNVAGTSASIQIAAAQWIAIKSAKPSFTLSQMYDLVAKTAIRTSNSKVKNVLLINRDGAIRG
jgi:Subtilase family